MPESLLLSNGWIRSLDGSGPSQDSIAISSEGKIVAVGPRDQCASALGRFDREIDLAGKTVLPGFHDHLGGIVREAAARAYLDLSGLRGLPEIFGTIEKVAKEIPKGEWIRGYGWSKGQWGWARFPHRADLDLVAPHHPVVLYSADGRVAWLNSQATTRLGINAQTPDPPGGLIERDSATRAATGILKENAVEAILINLPALDWRSVSAHLPSVCDDYFRRGIVGVSSFDGIEECRLLLAHSEALALPLRILCHPPFVLGSDLVSRNLKTGSRIGRVELGGLRIHVDGTLASQTSWMREPYGEDWNEFGIQVMSEKDLKDQVGWCYRQGFAPILHVSGDAAIESTLQVLSELDGVGGKLRPVLVNADLLDKESAQKATKLGARIAINPCRIESEREVGGMFWGARWERALDLRGWQDSGIGLAFGSDGSLGAWSPFKALKASLTRPEGKGRGPLTLAEGLRALSAPWSGDGVGAESFGIGIGKVADVVILDADPFEVPPDELDRIQVVATVIEGRVVFE